jgi:hypothetical protein
MSIRRLATAQLSDLTAVAQCLDNQWTPAELLPQLDGKRGYASIRDKRNKAIRRELMGALLTSEQLIVNRAFAYTNDVLADIYVDPLESQSLTKAFDHGMLVLFFAGERSFDDEVKFQVGEHHIGGNQLKSLQRLLSD